MPQNIINFWFNEIEPRQWWMKDAAFDNEIRSLFEPTHAHAMSGELYNWRETPEGRLAEIIVLDQFSRNMYRDTPRAFASDGVALILAQEAVRAGADTELEVTKRKFLYMPFMHSESAAIHEVALRLFSTEGLEETLPFEIRHKEMIDTFGRYPYRNVILGRESTPAEVEFLKQPGSSF